jgi:hypothetical protein
VEYIDPVLMPKTNYNEYYRRRREFFVVLNDALK